MDESRLRSLAADVESQVDLPAFAVVAARGARIRRRRIVIAGAVAALAVVLSLVGLVRTFDADRTAQPVHRPAPAIDQQGARRVLADPDAYVDPDATRVDGGGAMLAVVVARERSLGDGSGTCTDPGRRSALRWTGADGDTHAWVERVRYVGPVPGGFVVAAAPCPLPDGRTDGRSDGRSDGRTYLVDESGTPRSIVWGSGAARVCASRPGDVRCSFDVRTRRGSFDAAVALPDGAVPLSPGTAGPRWARSRDGRGLFWSEDGRTWRHRDTGRPGGAIVSASAAGRWGLLAEHNRVQFTSDGGSTWQRRDLATALRTVRTSDVDWTITPSGVLLGVTQLTDRGSVLFRSTDATWSRFVETDVRTVFGLVEPVVVGDVVYVVDDERWAVSTDDGATWRRTPGLP